MSGDEDLAQSSEHFSELSEQELSGGSETPIFAVTHIDTFFAKSKNSNYLTKKL